MKSVFKKGISVLLAILMTIAIPTCAWAETSYDFEVTPTSAIHYMGINYEFTATIKDVPQQYLVEKISTSQSAFEWSVTSGANVTSNNNYSTVDNGDGTYTVSENATVTMPDPSDNITSVVISAKYENSAIGSTSSEIIELKKPITSISATSIASSDTDANLMPGENPTKNNSAYNYYYQSSSSSGSDALYVNAVDKESYETALEGDFSSNDPRGFIDYSVLPSGHDDRITVTLIDSNSKYDNVQAIEGQNRLAVMAMADKSAPEQFQIKLSPSSGYRHEKMINVYICTAATKFSLVSNGVVVGDTENDAVGGISGYTNQELTIQPSNISPQQSNDSFGYTLYNNDGVTPCDNSWYSVTDDNKCKLNIKNAGTYYLKAYTVSKGNCLYRSLSKVIQITVNEISNIANLDAFEKKDDGTLDMTKPLTDFSINRSGSSSDVSIYDLSQNIVFTDRYGNAPSGDYVDYAIEDTSVATVNQSGVITAKKAGTTRITISSHNSPSVFKTIDLTVIQLADRIIINAPVTELPQGHSIQLSTLLDPIDASEDISWSSGSDAIIVDENGFIYADPNYSLAGSSEDVIIKAQGAESNKSATITIKVVPSNQATSVEITASPESDVYDGFYEANGEKYAYVDDKFTLKGIGYDQNNNVSSDVVTWRVRYEIYDELVDFSSEKYKGVYYTYDYSYNSDTYTINPKIKGKYKFYCIAVQRGHENDEITLDNIENYTYKEFDVTVVDKAGKINGATITLPTNSQGTVNIAISGDTRYDPITVTSMQPLIAQATFDASTNVVTISTGATATAGAQPIINVVSRSGSKAVIAVNVSNDINDAIVIFKDNIREFDYCGAAIRPEIAVFFGDRQLIENASTGYRVSYRNNTNAGTATIILTGTGDFVNSQKEIEFEIKPKKFDLKADSEDTEYNTTATVQNAYYDITESNPAPLPTLRVTDTELGRNLTLDTDYTVSAINNTRYGDATAIVTGKGNYTGSFEIGYKVRDYITADYITVDEIPAKTYTGSEIKPEVTVRYYGEVLDSSCYTIAYVNNVNKGTATVNITGITPYFSGKRTETFEIVEKSIADFDYISVTDKAEYYKITSSNKEPLPSLEIKDAQRNGTTLRQNTDYVITAVNNTTAGDATATVQGIGNYSGSFDIDYKVCDSFILTDLLEVKPIPAKTYTGYAIEPEPQVYYNGRLLEADTDYTVRYYSNYNKGTGIVNLTGKAPYFYDSINVQFEIVEKSIADFDYISVADRSVTYRITSNNKAPLPSLEIKDAQREGAVLRQNTDYVITSDNNTVSGIATATVQGIGNYSGSFDIDFKVSDSFALSELFDINPVPDQKYTGTPITPDPTIYYNGRLLEKDVDYSLGYRNNTNRGDSAIITIIGLTPFFHDSKDITFRIVPEVVESTEPTTKVDITATAGTTNDFYEKDGDVTTLAGDTFMLKAIGKDSNDKVTFNTFEWYFSVDDGKEIQIETPTASTNKNVAIDGTTYFSYNYNYNSDTYSITPKREFADTYYFNFRFVATDEYGNKVEQKKTLLVVPKATLSMKVVGNTVIPTGGVTAATISFNYLAGYVYNDVEFSSSDPTIATVAKDKDFKNNHTVIITANPDVSTRKIGTVTITAKSRDNQTRQVSVTVKNNIAETEVVDVQNAYDYTGNAIKPIPILKYDFNGVFEKTLEYNTDYTIAYKDNTNVGTATIIVTGKGNEFAGTKEITFNINKGVISDGTFSITNNREYYDLSSNGKGVEPALTVKNRDGRTLRSGTDYTITCKNNTAAGTATAVITGIGNYTGSSIVYYTVRDSLRNATASAIANQVYTGGAICPAVKVVYKGKVLSPSMYTVSYYNNVKVGVATAVIEGKLPYFKDKLEVKFNIVELPKPSVSKLSTKKKQMTIKWKKVSLANGYEIQYATDSKFKKGKKSVKVTSNATVSKTIKKLKSKKKYYVRIRSYRVVNGRTIYSKWSAKKNIKVK